jgi:chromosome segregation ATPase
MEKHFEAFQYLKEVLQAAHDAKANIPKFEAEAKAAEKARDEAVAAANKETAEAQGEAKAAQSDYDAKVKALDTALQKRQTLHDERMARFQTDADAAARHFEDQKSKQVSELEKLTKQVKSEHEDFEKKKAAMTKELAALQADIDRINKIMTSQREAVLALRPTT